MVDSSPNMKKAGCVYIRQGRRAGSAQADGAQGHKAAYGYITGLGGGGGIAGGLEVHPGSAGGILDLCQGVGIIAVDVDLGVLMAIVGGIGDMCAVGDADRHIMEHQVAHIALGRHLVDMDHGEARNRRAGSGAVVLDQVVITLAPVDGHGGTAADGGVALGGAVVAAGWTGVYGEAAVGGLAPALVAQAGQIGQAGLVDVGVGTAGGAAAGAGTGAAAGERGQGIVMHVANLAVLSLDVAVVVLAILATVVIQHVDQLAIIIAAQVAAEVVAVAGGGVQIGIATGGGALHAEPAHAVSAAAGAVIGAGAGVGTAAAQGVVVHVADLAILGADVAIVVLAVLAAVVIHNIDQCTVIIAAQVAAEVVAVAGGGVQIGIAAGGGALHHIPAGGGSTGGLRQEQAGQQNQGHHSSQDTLHQSNSFRDGRCIRPSTIIYE